MSWCDVHATCAQPCDDQWRPELHQSTKEPRMTDWACCQSEKKSCPHLFQSPSKHLNLFALAVLHKQLAEGRALNTYRLANNSGNTCGFHSVEDQTWHAKFTIHIAWKLHTFYTYCLNFATKSRHHFCSEQCAGSRGHDHYHAQKSVHQKAPSMASESMMLPVPLMILA